MSALDYPPPILHSIHENLLLSDAIEFNMKNNPDQPFFVFADPQNGIQVITHLEFGRSTHRVAHLLRPASTGQEGEVVAILAHTDVILHQAIVAGLIVAGLVPFPISPRNTPGTIAELLVNTSCHRLLTTQKALKLLIEATKASLSGLSHEVQIEEIPSHLAVYPHLAHENVGDPFKFYPAPKRPLTSDTCIILHSSGKSHFPSPSVAEIREHVPRLRIGCMALPSFHMFGIGAQIFTPVYGAGATTVFPPTSVSGGSPVIPNPQNVLDHIKSTKTNAIFVVPSFVQTWATSQEAINVLKELEFLGYAGGPLPPKVGRHLTAAGVRLNPVYGGTEFGVVSHILPLKDSPMDWEYLRFYNHTKCRWIPQGDGTFELQFLACDTHQPMVNTLPDAEGFATADVFKCHPTKEGLWKIIGRLDDVIVHSSGEKTIPGPMEVIIMSNSLVQAAIIFGRERDRTGVLIELRTGSNFDIVDPRELARLRNQIWPSIEEANGGAPTFSRIFKEMILFTSSEKPLPRTGKGTVMRQAALESYAAEIGALYDSYKYVESNSAAHSRPSSWNILDVEQWILEQAIELTSGQCTSPEIDIFDQGFDSLSATILRLRITHAMRCSDDRSLREFSRSLDQNFIYRTRSIKQLSAYTLRSLPSNPATHILQESDLIEALITKYSVNFGPIPVGTMVSQSNHASAMTVLMTGSTGNLGSQILAALLKENNIDKVYAFNRPHLKNENLFDRHLGRFADTGLDLTLLKSKKLAFITGDSTRPDLGIEEELYKEISSSITHVIHCAWKLDFNVPLASYEDNIKSSRHFIDLVRGGPNASNVQFLFLSSTSSVQSWDVSRGPVPEGIIEDSSVALGGGYGASKHVFERILVNSGLRATALRVGQICGAAPKGCWSTNEWFPMLVKSSVTIGVFPKMDGHALWLPADAVAGIVLDIARSTRPLSTFPHAFNLVHPQPIEQKTIIANVVNAIRDVLHSEMQVIPLNQWLMVLEGHSENATSDSLEKIPSIKLIEFTCHAVMGKGPSLFSMENLHHVSGTFSQSQLQQVGARDAEQWIQYWREIGWINEKL
ncbi:L-aminoadipate-semialdehyde dehydrogenase [Termitomyces sp. J132]|nr:L-aminoadipate-semialdehyde dehydrogenase [Termitomyces sp. J132]